MVREALVAAVLVLAGCATTLETVYVPAENKGWKLGHGSNKPGATLAEFIPSDESISAWSRMFTIQFLEGAREFPASFMNTLRAQMVSRCASTRWNVLSEDTSSITYEWAISDCPGNPNQAEIARLLRGNDGIHRIAYVRKAASLEARERETWLDAFSRAYVEKGGKRVVVAP